MNKRTVASCILYLLLVSPLTGAAEQLAPDWQRWSDQQFQQADKEGKLVLLDLSAEWCSFCKQMDAVTYQDPKVLALIEKHYIPVRIVDEHEPELRLGDRLVQQCRDDSPAHLPKGVCFVLERQEVGGRRIGGGVAAHGSLAREE